jgi:HAE1 family hydrophobic/amphiphilic exporter-1
VERSVKVAGETRSVEALRALVIASPMCTPIRLGDVAQVLDGPAEARSAVKLGGEGAIGLVVRKQSGTNTVQVAERVKESLARVQARLPEGSRVALVVDGARFIRSSISAVQEDMILGGVLAVLVVLLFLRNLRSTLVSAVALPTSIIGTFAVMNALHFTFNVVTMLALTLSIGLLIDDAIVVIENIVRHLEEGDSPWEAARKGASEIALAVLAVTLSVVAVFVSVAFMEGIVGWFFYQFGVTVAVVVLISYGVSMTLTPMLSARILKEHQEHGRVFRAIERAFDAVEALYRRALAWVLAHRGVTMAGAVAVLAITVATLLSSPSCRSGHEHGEGGAGAAQRHRPRPDGAGARRAGRPGPPGPRRTGDLRHRRRRRARGGQQGGDRRRHRPHPRAPLRAGCSQGPPAPHATGQPGGGALGPGLQPHGRRRQPRPDRPVQPA